MNHASPPYYNSSLHIGLIFGFSYCISYTCARTLEDDYGYNALDTGFVLLAYGIGSMGGSILGGRWSDRVLRKATAQGNRSPEVCYLSHRLFSCNSLTYMCRHAS